MSELVAPSSVNYPEHPSERETYMRLKLAKGERKLSPLDVRRIELARIKRARKRVIVR